MAWVLITIGGLLIEVGIGIAAVVAVLTEPKEKEGEK